MKILNQAGLAPVMHCPYCNKCFKNLDNHKVCFKRKVALSEKRDAEYNALPKEQCVICKQMIPITEMEAHRKQYYEQCEHCNQYLRKEDAYQHYMILCDDMPQEQKIEQMAKKIIELVDKIQTLEESLDEKMGRYDDCGYGTD